MATIIGTFRSAIARGKREIVSSYASTRNGDRVIYATIQGKTASKKNVTRSIESMRDSIRSTMMKNGFSANVAIRGSSFVDGTWYSDIRVTVY